MNPRGQNCENSNLLEGISEKMEVVAGRNKKSGLRLGQKTVSGLLTGSFDHFQSHFPPQLSHETLTKHQKLKPTKAARPEAWTKHLGPCSIQDCPRARFPFFLP
jgi:hypothetical protein